MVVFTHSEIGGCALSPPAGRWLTPGMTHRATSDPNEARRGRTRVALLGTLGPLHAEPLHYDVARLRALVERIEPDLLGVEADPDAWERGAADTWPLEVREALAPAAGRTDTVVVPLGRPSDLELAPPIDGPLAPVRAEFVRAADRILNALQRAADDPGAVSGSGFGHLCGLLCAIKEAGAGDAGRLAWRRTNETILERLVWVVRRDPGRRFLVAVRCHRVHWLRTRLRDLSDEIELVPFEDLTAAGRPRWSATA